MYGIGELQTQGTIATRSMAGVGVALRSATDINLVNPASHSMTINKSVLFSYGMEGSNYFNFQKIDGTSYNNSYAMANFHDIAIQLPLAKGLGLGISVTPYSSAGYVISTSENYADIGYISYIYEGGGDITEVKVGAGWQPLKNLSVGFALKYYWGEINRSFTMSPYTVTGSGTYYSTIGETSYGVSRIQTQIGLQWNAINSLTQRLTFGAVYDIGGDLSPDYTHNVYGNTTLYTIVASEIEEELPIILPSQLALGVSYQTPKMTLGFDYVYQDWYSQNQDYDNTVDTTSGVEISYNDFSTYKLGAQYTPNRNDVRNYFRRVTYRGGLRYGGYQQTFSGKEITQFAITTGASFPIKMNGISRIDAGLEYGSRGSSSTLIDADAPVGLIRQNYVKFSLGFTFFGEDYWFQRPKFD